MPIQNPRKSFNFKKSVNTPHPRVQASFLGQVVYCPYAAYTQRHDKQPLSTRALQQLDNGTQYHEQTTADTLLYHEQNKPRTELTQEEFLKSAHAAYDEYFRRTEDTKTHSPRKRDKRCFVASYAFGSDHEITHQLRTWRDRKLTRTIYGRMFIQVYYTVSPLLISGFGNFSWFRRVSTYSIKQLVSRLGVSK